MSWNTRRALLVLTGLGLLVPLAVWQVEAQVAAPARPIRKPGPGMPPTGETDPYEAGPGLSLVTDTNLRKKMEAANDYIRDEQWDKACHLLQGLIESKHDAFVVVPMSGAAKSGGAPWISVRAEANRKLGALPAAGLKFYQEEYGTQASDLLKEAIENGDGEKLAHVAQSFLHTEAGATAAGLLGTRKLDRGDFMAAALYFDLLLGREGNAKLSEETLIRAALSFHLAKEAEKEALVWKKLAERGDTVDLGGDKVALDDLRKEFDQYSRATLPVALAGSPVYRGNAARNGQGLGGRAFLEPSWKQEMIRDNGTRQWIANATSAQLNRQFPVLPSFFPVAATVETGTDSIPTALFRSFWGIHAVDVRTGKLKWESDLGWTLDKMARDHRKMSSVQQWLSQWNAMGRLNLLWENSVTGTLSTDGRIAYVIDDLQVPPFNNVNPYGGFQQQPVYGGDPKVTEAILHNELNAYDLRTGKLLWHVGGFGEKKDDPANELRESYFLGPPLPLGGKLYVLCEKAQELRLICLDPAKNPERESPVVWVQPLAATRDNKLSNDVGRRIQAAHLSYGEGILVCPTNAGAVLGVDLLTHSLVWARPYRDKDQADPNAPNNGQLKLGGAMPVAPGFNPQMQNQGLPNITDWKTSAPVIVDGKVVFTAPDGQKIYCLNLRDGTPLWTANRTDDDLYLGGVFAGKVLIVTKKSVRSLNLADGQAGWREMETGMPSGQGVASDNIYYLPLRTAALSKKPEIIALDAEHGTIVAHTPSRTQEVPGNLLFFDGLVISQSATEIAAFPQLKIKLDQVDKSIAKDPNDPTNRCERGELRLAEGDLPGAIEDLRVALDAGNKPPSEVVAKSRRKLHEALAEMAQLAIQKKDFASIEPLLATFEDVCKVQDPGLEKDGRAAEENRRLGVFLCLLGKGREQQGRLVEAFEAYARYGALSHGELMTSLDEPSVKANTQVWARGRINAMMGAAPPDQRKPLEDLIESRWQQIKSNPDPAALAAFVGMFGTQFHAGREARMELATHLMEQEGTAQLLTAEGMLLQVARQQQDRTLAARAYEAMARLLIRKNYLEDAAHYYQELGEKFADVPVRDGKTGADLWNELATDKRLLPYLGGNGRAWAPGRVKASDEHGNFMRPGRLFNFEVEGDPLPFFQRHRLALNIDYHEFRLTDRVTNEEWKKALDRGGNNQFNTLVFNNNLGAIARFPARTLGHLVVLQLGHMAYGIDPINKEVRWSKNLFGASGFAAPTNMMLDAHDGGVQIMSADGFIQRLGTSGPVEPGCLCLQTLDGLVAVDPVSGELLWTRSDVRGNCRVFGDADTLFVVEMNREGRAATSRAIRSQDGVTLDLPADFVIAYQNEVRTLGRQLLVKDSTPRGVSLRLYDILTGKDVWKKEFPANSQVLRSEDADVCGVVSPDGKVTVFDVQSEKVLLKAVVEPKHVEKAIALNLLQDQDFFYLGVQQANDPSTNPFGGPYPNVSPDTGVRQLPINGWFYAFSRQTGKLKWRIETPEEMLLMEEYKDLPVLVFTSRYQKALGAGGRFGSQQVVAMRVLEKRTGKRLFDPQEMLNGPQFHTYNMDRRAGKIELIAPNYKLSISREANPMGEEKTSQATPGEGKIAKERGEEEVRLRLQIEARQRALEAERIRRP